MTAKSFPLSSRLDSRAMAHERSLVKRAQQGDAAAFGDLYLMFLDDMYRYIFYRVSDDRDAEDLTEMTFLKAWEGLAAFRGSVPFAAWIYRIAHNVVIDHYRRRKETVSLEESVDAAWSGSGPEGVLAEKDDRERLAGIIKKLSPLHQHILVLRFVNGFSVAEVAEILERSTGSVRVLQHRALKAAHAFMTASEIQNG